MSISIEEYSDVCRSSWDAYVENHPDSTFFHKSGWKRVIENTFSFPTYYLYAQNESNSIVGILPLVHVKSFVFGNSLVSIPFSVYGGCLADTEEICERLINSACSIADDMKVDYMELRNIETVNDMPTKDLYVTFRKEISKSVEENMLAIPRKQRAMVRKGIKAGLVTEIDDNVDRFYKIYSTSVRNHGTPIFTKKLFENIKKEFVDDCEVRVITRNNIAISTVMSFYFKDEVLPYYGGGLIEARKYKAFDFMYWEIMRDATYRGIRIFDYGRSKKGTGSYSFKKNWGFTPKQLNYQYYLVNRKTIPQLNPLNPKYQLMIKLWKKLPLGAANTLGPMLSKYLG